MKTYSYRAISFSNKNKQPIDCYNFVGEIKAESERAAIMALANQTENLPLHVIEISEKLERKVF